MKICVKKDGHQPIWKCPRDLLEAVQLVGEIAEIGDTYEIYGGNDTRQLLRAGPFYAYSKLDMQNWLYLFGYPVDPISAADLMAACLPRPH